MGVKLLRFRIFRGSTKRHALVRALIVASVLSVVPLMEIRPETERQVKNHVLDLSNLGQSLFDKLVEPFWGRYKFPERIISGFALELIKLNLLRVGSNSKALCIGEGSALAVSVFREKGFSDIHRDCYGHSLFALIGRKHAYELAFPDNSFGFVYYGGIDQVILVPALLVREIERVLKPGGTGAVLVSTSGELYNSNSVVKSATSVSSLLKLSEIVHVNSMDGFTVVVFKKNVMEDDSAYFVKNRLPSDCQAVGNSKPYIAFLEPLVETKPVDFPKSVAYLPKFLDVSPKKRLIYIDIGTAEHLNASLWFLPSYPIDSKAFDIYIVDHNTSVLLTKVKEPGVTFIYHPGLAGQNMTLLDNIEPFPEDGESFNFLAWFEETAKYADFVVLKMSTSEVEMKFLKV